MAVQCLVLDVDGVLTNGDIVYTSNGEELKFFNAQDGLGLALARRAGLRLAVITGRLSPMVERRTGELHFDFVRMGIFNKSEELRNLAKDLNISMEDMAYMGDDLNDLGVLNLVGLPLAPANAVAEVKAKAKYITAKEGGHGAVREAIEYILKQDGRWQAAVADYEKELYAQGQ